MHQCFDFQYVIYETLRLDPLFDRRNETQSLAEQRELTYRRWKRIQEYNFADAHDVRFILSLVEVFHL